MKSLEDIHDATREFVAKKAKPRHKGPSKADVNLMHRIAGWELRKDRAATRIHKPGSRNSHKA